MNTHGIRRSWPALVGALALYAIAGTTLAQGQPSTDQPVLGGPKVKDNSIPGEKSRFGQGKGDKKDRALDRGIPPGVFVRAMDVLRGDGVSDSVRLSAEQDQKVRAVQREFIDSERAYLRQHKDEFVALRADLPPEARKRVDERLKALRAADPDGGRPGVLKKTDGKKKPATAPDEMQAPMEDSQAKPDPAKAEQAVNRMMELLDNAPKPKDAQSKVWALLTEAQRPVLQAEIERLQKEGVKGGGPGGPDAGPPGELREKMKNMTPEERQKFMEEMRQRRQNKKNPDGVSKPPPRPADVDVPKPEQNPESPK